MEDRNSKVTRDILSDITVHMKYAKYRKDLSRRETWSELVDRNKAMHLAKFPELKEDIDWAYQYVYDRKVLPSMRSLQFAGRPIELANARIYNCSYAPADHWKAFPEAMLLLLSGCGFGFSVQKRHIEKLPEIRKPSTKSTRRFLVGDSIEGWADAVKVLFKSYFFGGAKIRFDYSDIRPKGALLVTSGGKAPGPAPLRECLTKIENLLEIKQDGEKLTSLEVHDVFCYIAVAIVSGGVRRASLISFFDVDDEEMLNCKTGNWWEINPQRAMANNSAVMVRHKLDEETFRFVLDRTEASNAGEPGIMLTNDPDILGNPCVTADTMVLTSKGLKPVSELIGTKFKAVVNGLEYDTISDGFFYTGDKQVYELKTSTGKKVKTTGNHEFLMADGSWLALDNIKIGDKLKSTDQRTRNLNIDQSCEDYDKGWLLGNLVGDGCIQSEYAQICFWGSEREYLAGLAMSKIQRVLNVRPDLKIRNQKGVKTGKSIISCKPVLDFSNRFGITYENKWQTDEIERSSESLQAGYLQGLFDTDGTVSSNKKKGSSVRLAQVNLPLLEGAQRILSSLGIRSKIFGNRRKKGDYLLPDGRGSRKLYPCQESYDLIISRESIDRFASLISFSSPAKRAKLMSIMEDRTRLPYRDSTTEDVVSITMLGVESVYDVTVDEVHCFDGNGIILHNCNEISLKPNGVCNLTTINVSDLETQEEYNKRARAASIIGTLQASYTDFHYLRDEWKKTAEKEALLGVSMTGIASGNVLKLNMREAAKICVATNKEFAKKIGIRPAARVTTCKPEGTSSLVVGSASGIHAWHAPFYARRLRVNKNEAIYGYLKEYYPKLIEDEFFRPNETAVLTVPIKAPIGAIIRTETALELLERVKKVHEEWIRPGHVKGSNTHNVSVTVSVAPNEWEEVKTWMWENRECYSGISLLPKFESDHTYKQPPFSDITEEEFNNLAEGLEEIDLSVVVEYDDNTDLQGELACAAGACIVT